MMEEQDNRNWRRRGLYDSEEEEEEDYHNSRVFSFESRLSKADLEVLEEEYYFNQLEGKSDPKHKQVNFLHAANFEKEVLTLRRSSSSAYALMAKRVISSVDNINNFPDEVLSHIISFLPIKDAIRTSILSRKWRYLFTFISDLDYEFDAHDDEEVVQFMDGVNRVFFFSEKLSILRFRLKCRKGLRPLCIDGWIRALMSRNVQELDISIEDKEFDGLPLPNSLFSCKTLVILKLDLPFQSYDIKVPERLCLPSVKVSYLKGFVFSDSGASKRLFSSWPVLEDLVLQSCSLRVGCLMFCVSNSSLKRLTISRTVILPSEKVQLVINAPRLTYFEHSLYEFHSYQFVDVKSLTEVVVYHAGEPRDSMIYKTAVTDLLNGIKNVQSLHISSDILSVLYRHNKITIPCFNQMTNLKILDGKIDTDCLLYFLSRSECLENLVFQELSEEWNALICIDLSWPHNLSSKLWTHLKEIKILSFKSKVAEMMLVEGFLNKALALEKLTLRINTSTVRHSKVMKELLMLPRVSKKCRVVIV